jgi:hypothetical protein
MWWIRAMRLIEGTIVHRINHITRINRAIPRAGGRLPNMSDVCYAVMSLVEKLAQAAARKTTT